MADNQGVKTTLDLAAVSGIVGSLKSALEKGRSVHAIDEDRIPSHLAVVSESRASLERLLGATKNINIQDHAAWKKTPLHLAAANDNHQALEPLLFHGAKIDTKNKKDGKTPPHYGLTALHVAPNAGNTVMSTLLLKQGAALLQRQGPYENGSSLDLPRRKKGLQEILSIQRGFADSLSSASRNAMKCCLGSAAGVSRMP